ncbi:MAG: hypothetical protein IJ653_02860 [Bacteroidales bacterium]|nr:hypothetical protein [Bacteroidales bacterium]
MRTFSKLLALAAAALLCLPASLSAQNISVNTTSLTWSASDTFEQAILVSADNEVAWTVSVSNSAFIVDSSDGIGSDFIHVAPAAQNTGSSPVTAVLTVSAGSSSAQVSLSQSAPEVNPTERIALPGNWTLTRTYTNADGSASFEDITFYDGLGYAEQVVQVGASPSGGKNIVTPVWYDVMRRSDARSYLPYVSTNSSRMEESTSSVFTNQSAWYNNNGWSGQGPYAFSEQEYEASPLNRVLKVRKPGKTYSSSENSSKAVQISYGTNAADEVRKLSVGSSGAMSISGTYPAGTLHKVTTTDEDGSVSIVWTDVLGRTVLSRTLKDSGNDPEDDPNMDTYYVYDDAGHLCWVVTPEGSALLETSDTWPVPTSPNGTSTESALAQAAARYCYIYTWDGLGRQLSRKIPGKAVEYFVYDRAGRLVMSQDGLQRAAGLWVTCKYDDAGRLVRRTLLSSTQSRSTLQGLFDDVTEDQTTSNLLSAGTLLESYDYGSYANTDSSGLTFSAVSSIVADSDVDQTRIKGLKTYEKVAILSGTGVPSTYVQRAFYYDQLGRLIQTVESNTMGTTSRYSTQYDFLGNVTASREQHGSDYKTSTFTYDLRGRLLSESTGVNDSVTATMAYAYDPLGRLKTTTSGSGANAVTTTDTFNIQGWLTARSAMKGSTNIFSMSLGYYTPTISGNGTKPDARYSGDISSWTWTHGNGNSAVVRSYGFTYDGAHRLTDARYYAGTTAGSITNKLSERAISYDRAGNITALTRYDNSSSPVATSLSYAYTGNRRNAYSYDLNGNVTSDATNSLQSSYNLINLPAQIKSGSTVKANYSYLSDGTKTAAFTSASAGKDYVGSFTYTRGNNNSRTLESIAFGGGRIRRTGNNAYAVDYHITDHLGSVRAIVNASGTVVEQNDYYPFGKRHPNGLTQLAANRWRFSGKEEQDAAFGIAYSDFGARFYDRSAAWTAIDPMAEKYFAVSPYVYCNNNPILFVDPKGEEGIRYKDIDGIKTIESNIVVLQRREIPIPENASHHKRNKIERQNAQIRENNAAEIAQIQETLNIIFNGETSGRLNTLGEHVRFKFNVFGVGAEDVTNADNNTIWNLALNYGIPAQRYGTPSIARAPVVMCGYTGNAYGYHKGNSIVISSNAPYGTIAHEVGHSLGLHDNSGGGLMDHLNSFSLTKEEIDYIWQQALDRL